MIKYIFFLSLIVLFSCGKTELEGNKVLQKKPNIIFILADDQGYGDFGFTGNKIIKTPTLDSLAKHCFVFDNFHVEPVCSPTRASLMTGRYSNRTGVYDTYQGGSMMASNEITIAEYLKKIGYKTMLSGKWHLGDNYPMRPQDQGFDHAIHHMGGGIGQPGDFEYNFRRPDSCYFDPMLWVNGSRKINKGYCTDVFTDFAIQQINYSHINDEPLFLYLPYNAVHTPLQAPQEYVAMYDSIDWDGLSKSEMGHLTPEMSENDKFAAKMCYAMASNLDYNVARIIKALKDLKELENTIIIYTSDNGPQQKRYNSGYLGKKQDTYEGGVHVPLLIHYPFRKQNKTISELTMHFDILPTLLEILGIEPSEEEENKLDGISFAGLLDDKFVKKDFAKRKVYSQWVRQNFNLNDNFYARHGDDKIVAKKYNMLGLSGVELYDLDSDKFELINLEDDKKKEIIYDSYLDWRDEMMTSKNMLHPSKILIGGKDAGYTILNRNDRHGQTVWKSPLGTGYWDCEVIQEGEYSVTLQFIDTVPVDGGLFLQIGNSQIKQSIKKGAYKVEIPSMKLYKGPARVEAYIDNAKNTNEKYSPLWIDLDWVYHQNDN